MYLTAWRTRANISFMQNRFNVLSHEFQWRRRNDISAVSTFARRESKQIRTERVMSVAFIFVPLSISGTHATAYLIFPFCTAPGQLVCICHFRDSLANLTREIDSYWSPAKLMVIWSCLCLIVATQHRHFFRPNCWLMNFSGFRSLYGWNIRRGTGRFFCLAKRLRKCCFNLYSLCKERVIQGLIRAQSNYRDLDNISSHFTPIPGKHSNYKQASKR